MRNTTSTIPFSSALLCTPSSTLRSATSSPRPQPDVSTLTSMCPIAIASGYEGRRDDEDVEVERLVLKGLRPGTKTFKKYLKRFEQHSWESIKWQILSLSLSLSLSQHISSASSLSLPATLSRAHTTACKRCETALLKIANG
jgi:hypothetical protein